MSSQKLQDGMRDASTTSPFESHDSKNAFGRRGDKGDDDEAPSPKRRMINKSADESDVSNKKLIELTDKNLKDTKGYTTEEWVMMSAPRTEIANRFKNFIKTYRYQNQYIYMDKIRQLSVTEQPSFIVNFSILESIEQDLAYFLLQVPAKVLEIFNDVVKEIFLAVHPSSEKPTRTVHVRITDLPLTEDFQTKTNLNQLVRIAGVVTAITCVVPELSYVRYDCKNCEFSSRSFTQSLDTEIQPQTCPKCESSGSILVIMKKNLYRNCQRITVQESSHVSAVEIPQRKDCILLNDLRHSCQPGDEIDITGIYSSPYSDSVNTEQGFSFFETFILANYLIVKNHGQAIESLTEEDIRVIRNLSQDPSIGDRIVASIAPSIYGLKYVKKLLTLSLFGGVAKNSGEDKHRGDVHLLLCGDPQSTKSHFLKLVEKVLPKAISTTGKGNSAAGLTSCVHRDSQSFGWTLEAGDLVLADQGVCLIDEFEKMNSLDCVSIREAMDHQRLSTPEKDIKISLHARCTVIAATDVIADQSEPTLKVSKIVQLTEHIVSGFDILCMVPNNTSAYDDMEMAAVNEIEVDPIPENIFMKYIVYAKHNIHPQLGNVDQKMISKMYQLELKSPSYKNLPVTPHNHIEKIIRIAEAHAKMHLRSEVKEADINIAIRIVLNTFIEMEKIKFEPPARMLTCKQDFAAVRYLPAYVDKTLLIEQLTRRQGNSILLAPRHFGKSVNLSMLTCFFEMNHNPEMTKANRKLFRNLLIERYESTFKQHFAKYPIILLDFKCLSSINTYSDAFVRVRKAVHKAYMKHTYLKDSEKIGISEEEKKDLWKWCCPKKYKTFTETSDIEDALENLAIYLSKHFDGAKVLALVDEYDSVCYQAVFNLRDYTDEKTNKLVEANVAIKEIIVLCGSALGCLAKAHEIVDRVILTGVSYIITQGLSDLRNIKDYRFQEEHSYSRFYGLQAAEVKQLLKKFALDSKFTEVENRCNGYRNDTYSTLSVMEFLNEDGKLKDSFNYWKESARVGDLDQALHIPRVRSMLLDLLIDSTHELEIAYFKNISYTDVVQLKEILRNETTGITTPDVYFNFLVERGYFRVVELKEDASKAIIRISNLEIKLQFREKLLRFHFDHHRLDEISVKKAASAFDEINSSHENNIDRLKEIHCLLNNVIKPLDIRAPNEATYHHLMRIILFHCKKFQSFSEVRCSDYSQKRLDICLLSRELKLEIVIELKFDGFADVALMQILERKYYRVFERKQYNPDKAVISYKVLLGINVSKKQDVSMSILLNSSKFEDRICFS